MVAQALLVELFVEELPPKALKKLGETFAVAMAEALRAQGLADGSATVTAYASPRRLAAHITNVLPKAIDRAVSHKLMPVSVGLDKAGAPSPALLKKLAALGFGADAVASLKKRMDGKAEALFLDSAQPGASLAEGLQKAVEEALGKLPIPKVMGYQLSDGWTTVHFVRPAHRLVALHGDQVVPVSVLGLNAGRETHGHRFEASIDPIIIRDAGSYAAQLESEGAVIASFAARRAETERQVTAAATRAGNGLKPVDDDALLDEVTALVERPNVLIGQFEEDFLEVPQECLILTMKANQKYFPLLDAAGKLTNKFLIVGNIRPADTSAVVSGNERVVRPRLADAKFFFDQDRKKTLESRLPGLAKVVYHNKLGTQGERSERVRAIANVIGTQLGGTELAAAAETAARLAKADLLTDMVGEFPELQGIMGGYYARHDGLTSEIAEAIEDHYKPRFAGDGLPRNQVGVVVALADKLDTLCGLFGIGQLPTGDKDPFALRRHALGLLRIVFETSIDLDFPALISTSLDLQKETSNQNALGDVFSFVLDRARSYFKEKGYTTGVVEAVLFLAPTNLRELPARMEAAAAFSMLAEAPALASANKRIENILKKSGGSSREMDRSLFSESSEVALYEKLLELVEKSNKLLAANRLNDYFVLLSTAKGAVDSFFEDVMVMAENPVIRENRIALLEQLQFVMNRVADISKLAA